MNNKLIFLLSFFCLFLVSCDLDENNKFYNSEIKKDVTWIGSYNSEIEIKEPVINDFYYNLIDDCTYIFNGHKWVLLTNSKEYSEELLQVSYNPTNTTNTYVEVTINLTFIPLQSKLYYVLKKEDSPFKVINSDDCKVLSVIENEAKLIVEDNCFITFAYFDQNGYSNYSQLEIFNIDNLAPNEVEDLTIKYIKDTKQFYITWDNPKNNDFSYCKITSETEDYYFSETTTNSFIYIDNIEPSENEYTYKIRTVDNKGNCSIGMQVSIKPSIKTRITSISLDKYHFSFEQENQRVKVIALLDNLDELGEDEISFLVKEGDSVYSYKSFINYEDNSVFAYLNVPNEKPSDLSGIIYTVQGKIGNEIDDINVTRFTVTYNPIIESIMQSWDGISYSRSILVKPLKLINDDSLLYLKISGRFLDIEDIFVQLYDSNNKPFYNNGYKVSTDNCCWTKESGDCNIHDLYIQIPAPMIDGKYTVKVLVGDKQINNIKTDVQIYDMPSFETFMIPNVCISKKDTYFEAYVKGKNFKSPDIDIQSFMLTCESEYIFNGVGLKINNDSELILKIPIPDKIGTYKLILKYDTKSIESNLKVYSKHDVGDIVLNDNTIIKYSKENNLENNEKVIGVIYALNEYDAPLGIVGKTNTYDNEQLYSWAKEGTFGEFYNFDKLSESPNNNLSVSIFDKITIDHITFYGNINGEDDWNEICKVDESASLSPENYPIFKYALEYGEANNFTGNYKNNWYIPTMAELYAMAMNQHIINNVLQNIGGEQLCDTYWASSLFEGDDGEMEDFNFPSSYGCSRIQEMNCCCVHSIEVQ